MALMPVADALAAILAGAEPLPEEAVALDAAHHRILARDVAARRTQPPQAMSAMDGYAVRAADAADLSVRLKVIGEVAAGRPFERQVGKGEAVRIFTGGVIPDGADAVIIQEDTGVDGDCLTITEAAVPGRHIRPAGVDFREGDVLLTRGRRLTDAQFLEGWNSIFSGEMPGIAPLLASAAQRLPLYAFSNTNPAHVAHFSQAYADVLSYFRQIFLSSSIGLRKPDAEAYDHVVKAIGVPASRILFFDDSAANIEGARARGLCAIHVTSTDDVARALTALEI